MSILVRAKDFCFLIASCYKFGRFTGSGILVSFLALPAVMLGRLTGILIPYPHTIFFFFLIFSYVAIELALKSSSVKCEAYGIEDHELSEKRRAFIILNKIVAMVVALWGIEISFSTWKLLLFGFGLFHTLSFLKPMFLNNEFLKKFDHLPGALGILTYDIVFGLATNFVLRVFSFV